MRCSAPLRAGRACRPPFRDRAGYRSRRVRKRQTGGASRRSSGIPSNGPSDWRRCAGSRRPFDATFSLPDGPRTMTIHVLGFAGSLRAGSYNRALLRAATSLLPDGMEIETAEISAIPLFDADVEAQGMPPPVREIRSRIAAADAILIATPEYNYSIPGVLKNALDWISRPPDPPLAG